MRPLGIIALGIATAIAASCGARTPFDDVEPPSGASGPTGTSSGVGSTSTGTTDTATSGSSGTSGTSATTTGGPVTTTTSGTGVTSTTGGSGTGPTTGPTTTTVTTTGTSATTTAATTTGGSTGAGGAFPITTGVTTTGGTGGIGGSTGAGGSAIVRDAGVPVEAGVRNPLLGILPGVRPTPACNQCVANSCPSASACSGAPSCLTGVICYFAACEALNNQGQQLACASKCFNGDFTQLMNALGAVSCVYGTCGATCGRPNRPN